MPPPAPSFAAPTPTRAAFSASASASDFTRCASPAPISRTLSASASASARIWAACWTERWYSVFPVLDCTEMESSDAVMAVCCLARASASRSSRSFTAAFLPLDFGKFGGGGIASYGSICGAVLAGHLVINMIVTNATTRAAMMTDLMRWYEGNAFPAYTPTAVDTGETGLTKDFSSANLASLQVVPGSHLCHASVSGWCTVNGVTTSGADKKARCARLTGDVAGKVAEMLNAYLAASPRAYTAAGLDAASAACVGCHTQTATGNGTNHLPPPSASGRACTTCHPDKATAHP